MVQPCWKPPISMRLGITLYMIISPSLQSKKNAFSGLRQKQVIEHTQKLLYNYKLSAII